MQAAGIISNHPRDALDHLETGDIPFHYVPVTPATKLEQEAELRRLIREASGDLVVLAR